MQPLSVDVSKLVEKQLANDPMSLFVKETVARYQGIRRRLTGLSWTLRITAVVGAILVPFVIPVHQGAATVLSLVVALSVGVDSVVKTDIRVAKYTLALAAIARAVMTRNDGTADRGRSPPQVGRGSAVASQQRGHRSPACAGRRETGDRQAHAVRA